MIRIQYHTAPRTGSALRAVLAVDERQSYTADSAFLLPDTDNGPWCREFVAKWEAHAAKLGLEFEIDGDARHLLGDPVLMGGKPANLVILED